MLWRKSNTTIDNISKQKQNIDAEIAGLLNVMALPRILGESDPQIGTVSWAAQKTVIEKFPSISEFNEFFENLYPDQQQGWLSLLKGRVAEYLVAQETGSTIHMEWTIPDHDLVTSDGDYIQVKTGSIEYISSTLDDIDPDIEVHTGVDGAGLKNVTAHEWSDEDLESTLENLDAADLDALDLLGSSLVIGSILTGHELFRQVKRGEIELNRTPSIFAYKSAGKTARCALVGISLTSGSPIIVSAGSAYLIYKSRHLMTVLYRKSKFFIRWSHLDQLVIRSFSGLWHGLKHPNTRKTIRFTAGAVISLAKVSIRSLKWMMVKAKSI